MLWHHLDPLSARSLHNSQRSWNPFCKGAALRSLRPAPEQRSPRPAWLSGTVNQPAELQAVRPDWKAISWVLWNEWEGRSERACNLRPRFQSPSGKCGGVLESKFSWNALAFQVGQSGDPDLSRHSSVALPFAAPVPVSERDSWTEGQVSSRPHPGKRGALGVLLYSFHFITDCFQVHG